MILSRSFLLKLFKGCPPQLLPGPLLNTLSQITLNNRLIDRSSCSQMFFKIGVLKNFAIKLQAYSKETPTQLFSCEIFRMFKNTFFTEHLWWLLLNRGDLSLKTAIAWGGTGKETSFWGAQNIVHQNNCVAILWKGTNWKVIFP